MGSRTETQTLSVTKPCVDELGLSPEESELGAKSDNKPRPPVQIVWRNVILIGSLHVASLIGVILIPQARVWTLLWAVLMYIMSAVGVTAGAHRLWAHRSFKARLPFRIVLAIFNTMAFQNDIIEWARDHRVHHKFSETDADPHNAKRGFFFAHVGWLLVRKHPDVKTKGKRFDINDLLADPVCRIQRKFYKPLVLLLCFIFPTLVPVFCWGESWLISLLIPTFLRYCCTLNSTWLVNSAAHIWGSKPYDVRINPVENAIVVFLALGEGFHNYHHTFPQDYATSELGWLFNFSTLFIDFGELIGQVYDKKKMSKSMVYQRRTRTGDLSELKRE